MAKSRLTFGSQSLAALGAFLVISQAFQPMMILPLEQGQTAAWLLVLLATLVAGLLIWPVLAVLRSIPGATLMDLVRIAFGRPGLILFAILLTASLTFAGGLILRETSEMALSAAFPHSPQTFATTSLLLGSVMVAHGEASVLARLGRLLLPILVLSILGVLIGSVGWGEWETLMPFWGPGPLELVSAIPAVTKLFAPAPVVLYLMTGPVAFRRQLVRWPLGALLLSGLLLSLVTVVLTMVFPYQLVTSITYPLHAATRVVMGGRFFERLEGVWLFMWVISTIILTGAFLFAGAKLIARGFSMPHHRPAILPLATVVLTTAFFPTNQAHALKLHMRVAVPFTMLMLGLPLAAALVAYWRRRRTAHAP